jgi:hypothetical protein
MRGVSRTWLGRFGKVPTEESFGGGGSGCCCFFS